MRDSFVFYRGFYEALAGIAPEEKAAAYDAICEYALNGQLPDKDGVVGMYVKMAKPQIDANNRRYENGRRGGRPKNQTETKPKPKANQTVTKPEPNVNVNVNENVNVNVNENVEKEKRKRFAPPSLEEIEQYIRNKGYTFSAEAFYSFYSSNGWKVGRNAMRDWRAACVTWQKREQPKASKLINHSTDIDDLERQILAAQRREA